MALTGKCNAHDKFGILEIAQSVQDNISKILFTRRQPETANSCQFRNVEDNFPCSIMNTLSNVLDTISF